MGFRESDDLSGDLGFGQSKEVKGHPQRRRRIQRTLLVYEWNLSSKGNQGRTSGLPLEGVGAGLQK